MISQKGVTPEDKLASPKIETDIKELDNKQKTKEVRALSQQRQPESPVSRNQYPNQFYQDKFDHQGTKYPPGNGQLAPFPGMGKQEYNRLENGLGTGLGNGQGTGLATGTKDTVGSKNEEELKLIENGKTYLSPSSIAASQPSGDSILNSVFLIPPPPLFTSQSPINQTNKKIHKVW